jgi:hypothetical protein
MIGIAPEAWKQLLEPKQLVHFVGLYPGYWQEQLAGKYFRIMLTQQITYDRAYILAAGATGIADLSHHNAAIGDLGLYPTNTMTLYELLLGMKSTSGSMLCYPRFPPNEWFLTLEESAYIPNTANNNLRYLGPWSEEITPYDRPQVRIHTTTDQAPLGIQLYNDAPIDNKVVLGWLVNRCLMQYVDKRELTDKELERCREIIHAGIMMRGHWGATTP